MILTFKTSYSTYKYVLWANKWCSIVLWYYPRCLLHSQLHIVTIWATIATHLSAKMAKNGWKQVSDDTYFQNLLFYTKICSIILWYHPRCILYSWPYIVTLSVTLDTHFWAKMVEYGWKMCFDDANLYNLLFYSQTCFKGQWWVFRYPMVSLKVPTTLMTPYKYPMGHHSHSFVSQNGQKRL